MSLQRKTPLKRSPLKTGAPLVPKKKGKTNAWYKARAIEMAKFVVKHRTPYCERCRFLGKVNSQNLQGSHVYSVGAHPDMAADVNNIKTLCMAHHIYWWHRDPADAWRWFADAFPERANDLTIRSQKTVKVDWQAKYHELFPLAAQYGWTKTKAFY